MEAITLPIYSSEGKKVDKVRLDANVFDGTVNTAAIYQAVNAFRANQRSGLASTKTRSEVSGGGKKPWRQKGTGRARVGSIRSPLWRHGGVIFGPHPRDYYQRLPEKIKRLALKSSLNEKVKQNNLVVLEGMGLKKPKTKDASRILANLDIKKTKGKKSNKALLLLDKFEPALRLALQNISFLNINLAKNTHVYEIMSHQKIVINKEGLDELTSRLKT